MKIKINWEWMLDHAVWVIIIGLIIWVTLSCGTLTAILIVLHL